MILKKEIANILNTACHNAINTFTYPELFNELKNLNNDLLYIKEYTDIFMDSSLNENMLLNFESLINHINLLLEEYRGFTCNIIYIEDRKTISSSLDNLHKKTLYLCEQLKNRYEMILEEIKHYDTVSALSKSRVTSNLKSQLVFFYKAIRSLKTIVFLNNIDTRTDLQGIDIDTKKRCTILFNEKFGSIIPDENFFEQYNTIDKIQGYIIERLNE